MEDLIREKDRLKAEIDELTKKAQERDPDGDYSADAYVAQNRLTKLNDDYRQILTAIATGERTAATRTTKPPTRHRIENQFGIFEEDDNGNIIQVVPPNADDEMKKNIERRNQEGLIREREANAQAGRGYMTTAERQNYELDARERGVDEGTLAESIRQFDISQRNKDREFLQSERKTTADIGRTVSETGLNEARMQDLLAKTPAEIAEMEARGDLSRAQAEEVRIRAKKPTLVTSEGSTIVTMGPGGELKETPRQGYVPKTLGEIAARGGQMQQAMQAKGAEIQGRVDAKQISPEQGKQEWETWYQRTVAPEMATLQAAQEDALYQRGKEEAATRVSAQTAAQSAGQLALDAYKAQAPRRVGPGGAAMFGGALNAINRAAKLPEQDYSALITKSPNIMKETPEQAASRVLAAISPTAAQNTGQPMPDYSRYDIGAALAPTRWSPSGAPTPAPVTAGGGAAAATGGGGTVTRGTLTVPDTDPWAGFIRRDQADRAAQLQQGPNGQLARAAGVDVNDLMAAAASTGLSPYDYLVMTGEYRPTTGFPEPAPPPVAGPAAPAGAPVMAPRAAAAAPVRRRAPVTPAVPASAPAPAPAPYTPGVDESLARLGTGFTSQAPGFNYDPSNIAVTATPTAVPPVEPEPQYMPADYQFPGMQGILDAARQAYRNVPRVQFGPGGWRRPY